MAHYTKGARLGNDIRRKTVLDQRDAVFEQQFLLFQPLQGQLIGRAALLQGTDRIVEIAVLAAENLKLDPQHLVGFHRKVAGKVGLRIHVG